VRQDLFLPPSRHLVSAALQDITLPHRAPLNASPVLLAPFPLLFRPLARSVHLALPLTMVLHVADRAVGVPSEQPALQFVPFVPEVRLPKAPAAFHAMFVQ
jgi:hypothetical protein